MEVILILNNRTSFQLNLTQFLLLEHILQFTITLAATVSFQFH